MQLDNHTVGYLTYRAGIRSAMNTMIVRDTSRSYTAFSIHLGILQSYVSLNYTYKMEEKQIKLRGSIKLVTTSKFYWYIIHNCIYSGSTLILNCFNVNVSRFLELVHSEYYWNTEWNKEYRDIVTFPRQCALDYQRESL